jgi:hypothetical protein
MWIMMEAHHVNFLIPLIIIDNIIIILIKEIEFSFSTRVHMRESDFFLLNLKKY